MARVRVASASGGYDVRIERGWDGLREALGPGPVALVTDANVGPLWADRVADALGADPPRIVLPAGEAHKTLETWRSCVDQLLEQGVDRGTRVLALGGGVIGDLAGFAAATALRGLPLVLLPTSLLAMVDSSVGGKVGVDHPRGKNLVGAFHPPTLVWTALDALTTLPAAELRSGLGEVVKTALVADAGLLELLERQPLAEVLDEVVLRSVEAKARVVGADEREAGPRRVLNAGHTAGHALETALGHGTLRHGEAVGIGLLAELQYAVREGVCTEPELPARVARLLSRLGLPTSAPPYDRARAEAALGLDKKTRADRITVPLVVRAGSTVLVELPRTEGVRLLPEGRA